MISTYLIASSRIFRFALRELFYTGRNHLQVKTLMTDLEVIAVAECGRMSHHFEGECRRGLD